VWNVQGLRTKVRDCDFITAVSEYDICIFTETWLSKTDSQKNLIPGYKSINCAGRKLNPKAKRHDGGISVFYKEKLEKGITMCKLYDEGLMWVKLDKSFFKSEQNIYLCVCYIPPESSRFYTHNKNFDFFELIEDDIIHYNEIGTVILTGDFNARTGNSNDFICNIKLDKFVESFPNNICETESYIEKRVSQDVVTNCFGNKLLQICKNTDMRILNGRHTDDAGKGYFTFISKNGKSVVDYVITSSDNFTIVNNFQVADLTTFSDHCPISFSLSIATVDDQHTITTGDKVVWDKSKINECMDTLRDHNEYFVSLYESLLNGGNSINTVINNMSSKLYDIIFKFCGVKGKTYVKKERKVNAWYNKECAETKRRFSKLRGQYKISRSPELLNKIIRAKSVYNRTKRKAKNIFKLKEQEELEKLASSNPKAFWSKIRKNKRSNKRVGNDIDLETFANHFKSLSDNHSQNITLPTIKLPEISIQQLDSEITEHEVANAIKCLKRGKATGLDAIPSELFIDCSEFLIPHLNKIFNYIFKYEEYPDSWTKGVIIPIPKKGNLSDVNNYRGITLINTFSKLFSIVIKNRLEKFASHNKLLCDSQFGFRQSKRTTDAIFILLSIIQQQFMKKEKLYAAFVDFQKAFDLVNRDALWFKLLSGGFSSKIVNIVKLIYSNVMSCVRQENSLSDFFKIDLGVKQGEPLSPFLFIMFINDIESSIRAGNLNNYINVNEITMCTLLFADDMVLFSKNKEGLQQLLNDLNIYCKKWNIYVNTNKTKVCIFEKRKSNNNDSFLFNNNELEIVNEFTYLGVTFSCNGKLKKAAKTLAEQGSRAVMSLKAACENIHFNVSSKLSLFNKLVSPVLLYAVEIWGINNTGENEKVLLKYCKQLLCVKQSTPTAAVLGELGQLPFSVVSIMRAVKYWLHVMNDKNSLLYKVYCNEKQCAIQKNYTNCWSMKIKRLFDNLGYSHVWLDDNVDFSIYPAIKQRILDQFYQTWKSDTQNTAKLEFYSNIKEDFKFNNYLTIIKNQKYRIAFTKFICSAHNLEIEVGRYHNIPRNERTCKLCNQKQVENEYHFMLTCPIYSHLRKRFLPGSFTSFPNKQALYRMFKTNNPKLICNISKFIYHASELKKSVTVN
jgi:exonuclease III